jgi:uncharacterized radical SAM superfamily Fe-S cluster-containing enzyme
MEMDAFLRESMPMNMHFQDAYNYGIQRMIKCGIHYPTLDRRITFCTPIFMEEVEFNILLKEWRKNGGSR